MKLKVTGAGVLVPREMLPEVDEVDVRREGSCLILVPLCDPDDPIWEMGSDPVSCELPAASEHHDLHLYQGDQ